MKKNHFVITTNKAEIINYENQPKGFTLIELMIAMVVGLVLLAAVYSVFILQNKELNKQEQIAVMQDNARMAMDMMTREIMMAGYGPESLTIPLTRCIGATPTTKPSSPYSCLGIVAANASFISFSADLDGNGDLTGANENITYDRDESPAGSGIYALRRKPNSGYPQPVVENIFPSATELALAFTYLPATGTTPTTNLNEIRRIQITVTARTANIDPNTGNYYYYTLKSYVTPRNLQLSGF